MKRHGNWVFGVVVIVIAALWLGVVAAHWADAAEADSTESYDFSWLDPDKKIYVLQNRKYKKANSLLLSAGGGLASTNAYRTSYSVSPRATYYVSESLGFEVFYSKFSNSPNNTAKAIDTTGVRPYIIELNSAVGFVVQWIPWYAKINVFNFVLYFDWYFGVGAGSLSASMIPGSASASFRPVNENLTGYYFTTGHQYHVSENFVVRLDFSNVWYNAKQRAVTGNEVLFSSSNFEVGVGFRL